MIRLGQGQWARLHRRLAQEYPDEPSMLLIREKMRRELGFTVRRSREWPSDHVTMVPEDMIILDFYDDAKKSWFCLKYAEYL